jgi:hypothetical protein
MGVFIVNSIGCNTIESIRRSKMRYEIEEGGVTLTAETPSEIVLATAVCETLLDAGLFLNNPIGHGDWRSETFDIVDDKDLYTADDLLNMVNEAVKAGS